MSNKPIQTLPGIYILTTIDQVNDFQDNYGGWEKPYYVEFNIESNGQSIDEAVKANHEEIIESASSTMRGYDSNIAIISPYRLDSEKIKIPITLGTISEN